MYQFWSYMQFVACSTNNKLLRKLCIIIMKYYGNIPFWDA